MRAPSNIVTTSKYTLGKEFVLADSYKDYQGYYYEISGKYFAGALLQLFDRAKTGEVNLTIEQAVFTEVVFVLSSFYKVPRDKISQTLSELLAYKGIDSEKEVLLLALNYYQQLNMHIVDCLLLAKSNFCKCPILSFDQALNKNLEKDIYP